MKKSKQKQNTKKTRITNHNSENKQSLNKQEPYLNLQGSQENCNLMFYYLDLKCKI